MKAADLADLIVELAVGAPRGAEATVVLHRLAKSLRRFADAEADIPIKKLERAKLPGAQSPVAKAVVALPPHLEILRDDFLARVGNHSATMEVVGRIEQLRAADIVMLAAAVGMKTNSKTSGKLALQHLKGKSSEAERDAALRDKIRKGA